LASARYGMGRCRSICSAVCRSHDSSSSAGSG
jgi:hypothetical protein